MKLSHSLYESGSDDRPPCPITDDQIQVTEQEVGEGLLVSASISLKITTTMPHDLAAAGKSHSPRIGACSQHLKAQFVPPLRQLDCYEH
jgi:hypothetical protein